MIKKIISTYIIKDRHEKVVLLCKLLKSDEDKHKTLFHSILNKFKIDCLYSEVNGLDFVMFCIDKEYDGEYCIRVIGEYISKAEQLGIGLSIYDWDSLLEGDFEYNIIYLSVLTHLFDYLSEESWQRVMICYVKTFKKDIFVKIYEKRKPKETLILYGEANDENKKYLYDDVYPILEDHFNRDLNKIILSYI